MPVIFDETGKLLDTDDIDDILIDLLIEYIREDHNLFTIAVNTLEK